MNEVSAYLHLAGLRLCPGYVPRTALKMLKLFAILYPFLWDSTAAMLVAIRHMQYLETQDF